MRIIVPGAGAGDIGSHPCVRLLEAGHDVTVIDNLFNSSVIALDCAQELADRSLRFVQCDQANGIKAGNQSECSQ